MTPAEIASVTRNDSTAACDVTASQKACQPPPAACQTIAASGNSTITESHSVATPTRRDVLPDRPDPRDPRGCGGAIVSGASLWTDGPSSGGLRVDLGDAAGALVEQLRIHRAPATQVGDRPQFRRHRELVPEIGRDGRVDRPETGLRPQLLRRSAVYWKFLNAIAAFRCGLVVTTATGFSILKVCGGLTCSTGLPARSAAMASFS